MGWVLSPHRNKNKKTQYSLWGGNQYWFGWYFYFLYYNYMWTHIDVVNALWNAPVVSDLFHPYHICISGPRMLCVSVVTYILMHVSILHSLAPIQAQGQPLYSGHHSYKQFIYAHIHTYIHTCIYIVFGDMLCKGPDTWPLFISLLTPRLWV